MSINRRMAKGAAWMVGLRLFHQIIGFVSTLILARLLVPEDFGIVAMAMVLFQFLIATSDLSIQVPLIQKNALDDHDLNSAWSLQLLIAAAQAVILVALAQPPASCNGWCSG